MTTEKKEQSKFQLELGGRRSWFPGHMKKSIQEMVARLKLVDIVLELRDSRVPLSSRNTYFEKLIGDKRRLILLNKVDLSDPDAKKSWENYFRSNRQPFLFTDSSAGQGTDRIYGRLCDCIGGKKNIKGRLRVMVAGIPNVGKSTLINRLARRKAAKTGFLPGVTRTQQWIRVGNHFDLLDTPGVLRPGNLDAIVAIRLAITGGIKSDYIPIMDQALYIYELAVQNDRLQEVFVRYYKLESLPESFEDVLETVGRKRGCLLPGGIVDIEKTALLLAVDFRHGRLGKVTLDSPEEDSTILKI